MTQHLTDEPYLVRCQTCHRFIPKEVSLQPIGQPSAHLPDQPQTLPTREQIAEIINPRAFKDDPSDPDGWLRFRDQALATADAILALSRPKHSTGES